MGSDDADHYRKQAQMCREQATWRNRDPGTRDLWLKLALEYDRLAGDVEHTARRTQRVQQQPVQQQQQKKRGE